MKKAYRVKAPTTNAMMDTIVINGRYYHPCTGGYVYIITDKPSEIFRQIPSAIEVTEVGIGLELEEAQ